MPEEARGIVGRSSDMYSQPAQSGEFSPRGPAILAELAMVVRNVGSLHDHRALLRYLVGIEFPIGNSLEDTSMAVEDDPSVFLCEFGCPVKGIDS